MWHTVRGGITKKVRAINRLCSRRAFQRTGRDGHNVTTYDCVVPDIALSVDEHRKIIAERRTSIIQCNRLCLLEHSAPLALQQ